MVVQCFSTARSLEIICLFTLPNTSKPHCDSVSTPVILPQLSQLMFAFNIRFLNKRKKSYQFLEYRLLRINEWKSECNLPSSNGKLHLRHLPISDNGYCATMIKCRVCSTFKNSNAKLSRFSNRNYQPRAPLCLQSPSGTSGFRNWTNEKCSEERPAFSSPWGTTGRDWRLIHPSKLFIRAA